MKRVLLQLAAVWLSALTVFANTAAVAADRKFENVYPFPMKSFWDAMKFRFTRNPAKWPESLPVPRQPSVNRILKGNEASITWIGHSTFLLEFENFRVLTDPVYSQWIGFTSWLSADRVVPPALTLEQTPKVDLILISHDHFDHMDLPSLEFFAKRDNPLVIAGLGSKPILEDAGFKNIVELDWWSKHTLNKDTDVTFVPAQHWSMRVPFVRNTRLWGGFYLKFRSKNLYFVGDTGYHPKLFKEIHERAGAVDFAFIPVGAYAPRDFVRDQHIDPDDAVELHKDVRSKKSVGMHFGTFQLTDEPIDEPCRLLSASAKAKTLQADDFTCMEIGETRTLFGSELQADNATPLPAGSN
jgi:L-ascorbate metabolism protein UlaG (beta-lactamase superfamily)